MKKKDEQKSRIITDRKKIAHKEATRDPIFLFQLPRIHYNEDGFYEVKYNADLGELVKTGTNNVLCDRDIINKGWADVAWDTIGVFLTREEAEEFGETTSYRYGVNGKNVDWRVYCIALEKDSVLAEILRSASENVR